MNIKEFKQIVLTETLSYLQEIYKPIKGRALNQYAGSITHGIINGIKLNLRELQETWLKDVIIHRRDPQPLIFSTIENKENFIKFFPKTAKAFETNQINSVNIEFLPKIPPKEVLENPNIRDFYKIEMGGGLFATEFSTEKHAEMVDKMEDEAENRGYERGDPLAIPNEERGEIANMVRADHFEDREGNITLTILMPFLFTPEMQTKEKLDWLFHSLKEFSVELSHVVLHELEHSSHDVTAITATTEQESGMEEIFALIKTLDTDKQRDVMIFVKNFLVETEIKAYATGYMRKAKNLKVPIDDIIDRSESMVTQNIIKTLMASGRNALPMDITSLNLGDSEISDLLKLLGLKSWDRFEAVKFANLVMARHAELVKYYVRSRWPDAQWREDIDAAAADKKAEAV
tara:strand:- start:26159 stop:27367 length:1209 start_codon:yes stop_codon:yes gene_type:complete